MALKKTFPKNCPGKCKVTFSVSEEAAHGAESVTIAGDFNSWSSTDTTLKKNKDGSFYENDWEADKYIPAPFSHTDNSVVSTIKK